MPEVDQRLVKALRMSSSNSSERLGGAGDGLADYRHDDVADQRRNDLAKSATHHDTDRQVDDIALHRKLFKLASNTHSLFSSEIFDSFNRCRTPCRAHVARGQQFRCKILSIMATPASRRP